MTESQPRDKFSSFMTFLADENEKFGHLLLESISLMVLYVFFRAYQEDSPRDVKELSSSHSDDPTLRASSKSLHSTKAVDKSSKLESYQVPLEGT